MESNDKEVQDGIPIPNSIWEPIRNENTWMVNNNNNLYEYRNFNFKIIEDQEMKNINTF